MQSDQVLKVMTFSLRVGQAMLESAVSTSDVEEAIRSLTTSFGLGRCEVSVTLNVITLSYLHPAYEGPITLVKVVDVGEPRLDRLVALDTLRRRIETHELSIDEAVEEIEATGSDEHARHRAVTLGAALVSAAAWVVFAGGGLPGALSGVVAALVIELLVVPLSRTRIPGVFAGLLAAAVVVAVPNGFAWAGVPIAITPAIVGGLYPLLPGGALVASVTDGLSGAPVSSIAKGLEAGISATATALGTIGAISFIQWLGFVEPVEEPVSRVLLLGIAGGVATAGLAIARSLPMRLVPAAGLIGVAAWSVTRIEVDIAGPQVMTFVAAVVIGLGAQLAARVLATTSTVFTSTAVYVLVPGVTFYLAMAGFAQGATGPATDALIRAVGTAGAIAAGIALGVAVGRSVPTPRPVVSLWRRTAGPRRRVPRR